MFTVAIFSVVCVLETEETRERVAGMECVHVDHTDYRQWSPDVSVQSGMVRYTKLPQQECK